MNPLAPIPKFFRFFSCVGFHPMKREGFTKDDLLPLENGRHKAETTNMEAKKEVRFEKGVPVTHNNLAIALEGEEGSFLCHQGGQAFITEAQRGHSIVSGPTPVGPRTQQQPTYNLNAGPEPWVITKLDDRLFGYQGGSSSQGGRQS